MTPPNPTGEQMGEIPDHLRIDIDAVTLLIKRSIAFTDWAAGEGICPAGYKDADREERNPDEFLFAYSLETADEDWDTLADRIAAAFKSLDDENGRLKCEVNHYKWERDNAEYKVATRLIEAIEDHAKKIPMGEGSPVAWSSKYNAVMDMARLLRSFVPTSTSQQGEQQ